MTIYDYLSICQIIKFYPNTFVEQKIFLSCQQQASCVSQDRENDMVDIRSSSLVHSSMFLFSSSFHPLILQPFTLSSFHSFILCPFKLFILSTSSLPSFNSLAFHSFILCPFKPFILPSFNSLAFHSFTLSLFHLLPI